MSAYRSLVLMVGVTVAASVSPSRADDAIRAKAQAAMWKAAAFYHDHVAIDGGYLWRYSADLGKREGEGKVTGRTAWVQPPGTPSVGLAFVRAYEATGDDVYLIYALHAAEALRQGQLRSGGWPARIDFDPDARRRIAYRVDEPRKDSRDVTSLDDDTTQAAVRFLIHLDRAANFKDERVHEMVRFALNGLLAGQYPNGAWPQAVDPRNVPDPQIHPVKKARFPDTWSRTYEGHQNYWYRYTLNDNLMHDMIDTLLLAAKVYNEPTYRHSALKTGDFLLLAQLPEPQPGWAQQYDFDMHPAWARKFEPPAVTAGEAQGIMLALMRLYRETRDRKWLDPIPRALAYYKTCMLPDGKLARFYELMTNKPLYFTRDYQLTYDDSDMPTHYAFKVANRLDAIEREYEKVKALPPDLLKPAGPSPPRLTDGLTRAAQQAIDSLDVRGAWVEDGRLKHHGGGDDTTRVIDSDTFVERLTDLADYLAATR